MPKATLMPCRYGPAKALALCRSCSRPPISCARLLTKPKQPFGGSLNDSYGSIASVGRCRHVGFTPNFGRVVATQRTDALGHKPTHALQKGSCDGRNDLLDHVVSDGEHARWNDEAKSPGGVEIDNQLELGELHDRQIG